LARGGAAALLALAIAAAAAGCGGEEGVAEGAIVTAYAEADVCGDAGAQVAVVEAAGRAPVKVRIVCLPDPRGKLGVDLATVGANARRAAEDSSTIAYLEAPDPAVNRFSHPILEAAGIGWITASRGRAQRKLLSTLGAADSSSLRADVREELGQS
jgi:hypothetical protein